MSDMSWVMTVVKNELCEQMLVQTRGNQAKAARLLGINRGTFRDRIKAIHERKEWLD
ncbi:hypothetical protein JFJ08_07870 [Vibrio atlanticus]|nr:hypothetical protein [Vibrio atlanticus]